jgi:WD40 repeat protein
MAAFRLATIALLLGASAAACGSTGSGPVQVAPAATGATAVVAAPAATAGTTASASKRTAFPATSATDVISLAELHPPGTVVYSVSDGSGADATIRVSRLGSTGAIEWTRASGASWVGFANSRIVYACASTSAGDPACHRGDPGGLGTKAAYAVAKLLGADAVRTTFSPFLGAGDKLGVAPDRQLERTVSCMAISADNGDYRLCATKDGQITQLNAGTVRIQATSLATAVAGDVAAPAPVQ